MIKKYSEEFKLSVVKEYYEGNLGVRLLANKYNLPSKNYISDWINHFKANGKIPQNASVSRVAASSTKKVLKSNSKTPYEKELENRIKKLEAELAFYKKCDEIIAKNKKK